MQTLAKHGVPLDEHPSLAVRRLPLDWEGARVFLEIARHGSFRAASEAMHLSVNALRRRCSEFEHQLGVHLLVRDVFGVTLTTEGELVLDAVKQMEQASFGLIRARDETERAISGTVRLAVTEGLGTFWVAPRLIEFQRAYPKLLVDMHCAMVPADVLRLEADVGVQITTSEVKDLKTVKLGRLHTMPFAARDYLSTYGKPSTLNELRHHRIVLQVSDQVDSAENFQRLFPGASQSELVALRTNVSSAHYWAIAKGAGIGMLPTYANAMGAPVLPVDIVTAKDGYLRRHYDIWLTYHPDTARIVRVRRLIEWIREAFCPKRFPWFADEFIHPKDLPNAVDGTPLPNWFAGFGATQEV